MKSFTFISISLIILGAGDLMGQCNIVLTANSTCVPSTLTLAGASPYRVQWKKDGNVLSTIEAVWDSMPAIILASYKLTEISDMALDPEGNIYIAENTTRTVKKWVPGAESGIVVTGSISGNIPHPNLSGNLRIFLDDAGDLYVSEATLHRVVKFPAGSTTGIVVAGYNGPGTANNQLNSPAGIYVDAAKNLYIADDANDRVMRWAPGATSGLRVAGGNGEGSAANQLYRPVDVHVRGNNIFIADYLNFRIQKWVIGANSGVTVAGGNGNGTAANQINAYKVVVDRFENVFCIGSTASGNVLRRWQNGTTTGVPVIPKISNGSAFFLNSRGDWLIGDISTKRILRHSLSPYPTFSAASGGEYSATVFDNRNCTGASNTISVNNYNGHQVSIKRFGNQVPPKGTITICDGEWGSFSASITNSTAGTLQYTWKRNGQTDTVLNQPSEYTPSFLADGDTISVQALQLSNGCSTQDTVFVKVLAVPAKGLLASSSNCLPATLTYSYASPISGISWSSDVATNQSRSVSASFLETPTVLSWNKYTGGAFGSNDFAPKAFQMSAAGDLYILDSLYPRILKIAPNQPSFGVVAGSTIGGSSNNLLNNPSDFVLDDDGTLFVADFGNNRILRFAPGATNGISIASISAGVLLLKGDWLYMGVGSTVYRCGKNGGVPEKVINNSFGSAANQLSAVAGLYIDDREQLYIVDSTNDRVQKWPLYGSNGVTVAGGNGYGFASNQLASPAGLYVDGGGNLYTACVAEINGQKFRQIRKWMPFIDSAIVLGPGKNPRIDSMGALLYIENFEINKRELTYIDQFQVSHNFFQGANIYVTGISAVNGCTTPPTELQLSGALAPTVSIVPEVAEPCEGTPAKWNALVTNGGTAANYLWMRGADQVGSDSSYSTSTLMNKDSLSILVTNNVNKCYQKATILVTLKPMPVVDLVSPQPIGVPNSITMQSNGVLPSIAWSVNGVPVDTTHNWKERGVFLAGISKVVGSVSNVTGPMGIHVDSGGIFYTTDAWGIKKWRKGNQVSEHIFSNGFGPPDVFRFEDSLYIVGSGSSNNLHLVNRHSLVGANTGIVAGRFGMSGNADSLLSAPRQIFITGNRDLYVADGQRVTRWPRGSTKSTQISKQFAGPPQGVSADQNGHLFITTGLGELYEHDLSTGNHRLVKSFGNEGIITEGNVTDNQGNVFIAAGGNSFNGMIIKYNSKNGHTAIVAGNKGGGDSLFQLSSPQDVGVDEFGNLLVADTRNNRILMFTADSAKSRQVNIPGFYKVVATGYNGCVSTDSIRIYAGSYIFNGTSSSWNDPSNWSGNAVPDGVIPADYYIEINPANDECLLNGNLNISRKSVIIVKPGKKLRVTGNIITHD